MKLIKKASGRQTVKISKREWESIGKKHGWMKAVKEAQVSGKKRFSSDYLATEYVSEQNGSPVEKIGPISEDSGIHKGGNEWTRKIWRFKDPTAPIGSGNEVLSYFMEEYTETIADGSTMAEYYIDTLSDEREPRQRPITPR